jgi:hypothetical protein
VYRHELAALKDIREKAFKRYDWNNELYYLGDVQMTAYEIAQNMIEAVGLEHPPLYVYGTNTLPPDAVSSVEVDRCIAKAIFGLAKENTRRAIFIEKDEGRRCCPGGQGWFGFKEFMPHLPSFLSNGDANFRGGASEHLFATPELAHKRLNAIGKVQPPGKYIVPNNYKIADLYHSSLLLIISFL